ncbi:trypsin-like [Prorops nasuta]|uniref:trypsin-like n=1 Tax=Prorops nasuta TaxID=863751 RepID=UPI0034CF7FA3
MCHSHFGLLCVILTVISTASKTEAFQGLYNGKLTSITNSPYSAAITNNYFDIICNGVLIRVDIVLTAAHCLHSIPNVRVVTGITRYAIEGLTGVEQFSNVKALYYHKQWNVNDQDRYYDIAAIRLAAPIKISIWQRPIGLPDRPPPNDVYAKVSGWGTYGDNREISDNLRELDVCLIDIGYCQKLKMFKVQFYHICTRRDDGWKTCVGANGSPLVYNDTLLGLATGGVECEVGAPGLFTSTYHVKDFINEVFRRIKDFYFSMYGFMVKNSLVLYDILPFYNNKL